MTDIAVGDTIYHKFTTRQFSDGAPTTLSGTPVVSVYENDSVTQITAGITLSVDFDSVTGLNHLTIVASSGNGYESGKFYQAVITTGTVGGTSVVGEVVLTFSCEAAAVLRPTTAGRTVDVAATGEVGLDFGNTTGSITGGELGVGAFATGAITAAAIASNAIEAAKIASNAITAAKIATDAITADKIAANAITSSELADNAITAAKIATDAITAAKIAADAIGASELATDAVDEIVARILPDANSAFSNIEFVWVAASDHVTPVTSASGTSVTRSIDGGAFGSATGTLAEVGNGVYQFDASAADMNGKIITFRFVATGGTPGAPDDAFLTVVTNQ